MEQLANAITFYAFFVESKLGKTGLTVTIDVWELTQAGGATEIVTAGSASEIGDGLYKYVLSSGSVDAVGEYIAVFKTATTTVDAQHIPALWIVGRGGNENLDAAISSRNATTPPTAAANATAVRSELATELARIDDEITSRADATHYTAERAAKLDLLSAASVTVASPVASDGTAITLIYGDDYYNADGRALTFTGTNWPVLTGGTVTLRIQTAAGVVAVTGTVTGAATCRFDLAKTQVETLGVGVWRYDLEAALVTSLHIATLAQGYLTVAQDVR